MAKSTLVKLSPSEIHEFATHREIAMSHLKGGRKAHFDEARSKAVGLLKGKKTSHFETHSRSLAEHRSKRALNLN